MVPAVGQAAIAIQCRDENSEILKKVLDRETEISVSMERAFQTELGGGCHTALGVHVAADTLWFYHDQIGLRSFPLSETDLKSPDDFAKKELKRLGFAIK